MCVFALSTPALVQLLWLSGQSFSASRGLSLEDAIREAVFPHLQSRSTESNDSAWGFAYRDRSTRVAFCEGYSNLETKSLCSTNDMYAWGSTTKTQTALSILQLVEIGKVDIDDFIVQYADPYLSSISDGLSLEALYGPQINAVTLRHLLQMESGIKDYDNGTMRKYQNEMTHRSDDLNPVSVLQVSNKTFECAPGSCASYSSTNYVLLGLVLASQASARTWDQFDQRSWITASSPSSFPDMYYPVHGESRNFTSANVSRKNSTIPGYQKWKKWMYLKEMDVSDMSCLQGWTCGNLVLPTADVAEFFWTLLGPPSRGKNALLKQSSLEKMLTFKVGRYLGDYAFGYGLGLMNFTSMNWGFQYGGTFYGHNGLTYGFGAQSGYNYDLDFAVTWVNNNEVWIGPDAAESGVADPLYTALVDVVKKYRQTFANISEVLV